MRTIICLALAVVTCFGCVSVNSGRYCEGRSTACGRCAKPEQVLRHVVLFGWKEGTTPEQIKAVEDGLSAFPAKIDAVHDFEWGTDVSGGDRAQGYTHCLLITFLNEEGLAEYLPHPAHQEFAALARPHIEKLLVLDYWAGE